jgi:thiosulfate/3-mercaptopyruvate sulfurtransferase
MVISHKPRRYDTHGVFSSPRALFMFRAFGHKRSSILDGGLYNWEAHGCPVESGEPKAVSKSSYPVPKLDQDVIRSKLVRRLKTPRYLISSHRL